MTRLLLALALLAAAPTLAQETPWTPDAPGSDNLTVLGHIELGEALNVMDMEVEQEMDRPFAYVARGTVGEGLERGTDFIDISDPSNPEVLYRWRIEDSDLHVGLGGMDIKYFKWDGRYYVVQSTQFGSGGPNADLGAVIFDVTGLPDASTVTEVARIREPELPGGFHNIFIYQHSNGTPYLLTTTNGPQAHAYDLGEAVSGDVEDALAGVIPGPETNLGAFQSYHDLYAGWHPDSGQDRFYGGGTGGYFVYDISDIAEPELEFSLTGVHGVNYGHTFTPDPTGRYAVTETEYKYAPLRIFDMKPLVDGERESMGAPISAWTAHWEGLVHNHEVRWPYVFVSGYHDGLQVFTLEDPHDPETVAYYDTFHGPRHVGVMEGGVANGAFGVDVRNADGLILISDMSTGFWTFRMDGFDGWDGADYGVPNISSAQDWDTPPGAD